MAYSEFTRLASANGRPMRASEHIRRLECTLISTSLSRFMPLAIYNRTASLEMLGAVLQRILYTRFGPTLLPAGNLDSSTNALSVRKAG
jgi:hypothetical protein